MYGGLCEIVLKKFHRWFHSTCWGKESIVWKFGNRRINNKSAWWLKNETSDVIVSIIILRTDNKKLNEQGIEVNLHLKELSKEKNIDNFRKIKAQHHNKGKLNLTKYSSRKLGNNFVNEISDILWQIDRGNSNANVEVCNSEDDLTASKYDECNATMKTIRSDNENKLIFCLFKYKFY